MGIELPEYDEVAKKAKQLGEDELNPIEKFIHDNEPAGIEGETKFRTELQTMLDWAIENSDCYKKPSINQPQGFKK